MKTEVVHAQIVFPLSEYKHSCFLGRKEELERIIHTQLAYALAYQLLNDNRIKFHKHVNEDFESMTYSGSIVIGTGNEDEDN